MIFLSSNFSNTIIAAAGLVVGENLNTGDGATGTPWRITNCPASGLTLHGLISFHPITRSAIQASSSRSSLSVCFINSPSWLLFSNRPCVEPGQSGVNRAYNFPPLAWQKFGVGFGRALQLLKHAQIICANHVEQINFRAQVVNGGKCAHGFSLTSSAWASADFILTKGIKSVGFLRTPLAAFTNSGSTVIACSLSLRFAVNRVSESGALHISISSDNFINFSSSSRLTIGLTALAWGVMVIN